MAAAVTHAMHEAVHIVVLGWGSLIPKPSHGPGEPLESCGVRPGLATEGGSWHADGPLLPPELARTATTPETTLPYPSWVITPGAPRAPALYARLPADLDLEGAASALEVREGTDEIGRWPARTPYAEDDVIGAWATAHHLDGVVWTALTPRWFDADRPPSEDAFLALVHRLVTAGQHAFAEDYIRRTPAQITSPLRRAVERALGWWPSATAAGG